MKRIIYILVFICSEFIVNGQSNPSGFPTQLSTGWFRQGWHQSDSGEIIAPRTPNFTPRFPGTTILYQQNGVDTSLHYWTGGRWIKITTTGVDTTSLSNRINLKLNISDTASMLLPYLRKADTTNKWVQNVYARSDSLFKQKNGAETFVGKFSTTGVGTVTSVALSMPSAFTVTGSPITGSGTFGVSGAGTSLQYIRGNGTLATFDTTAIPNFSTKVRGLLSGVSPISYNSATGTFSLDDVGVPGACTNCNLSIDAKGRVTLYANGSSSGGGVDTVFRTPGIDSIYFTINNIQYAIKDSTGGGGGSFSTNNIGTGFAWVATPSGNIKRVANGYGLNWDSTTTANTLTAKADTSVLATQYDLLAARQNLNSVLLIGNIDTASTIQFGYSQGGFVQSIQQSPTDTIWEGAPQTLYPFRGSDTGITNPRVYSLFTVRTHRYDVAEPPNVIMSLVKVGEEAIGKAYMRIGGSEWDWYNNYEYHPIEMKLIGSASAIRMQSVTMNRTTGVSTWTQRATQHIFSDISDNQMLTLARGQSTLTASGTTQPLLRLLLQSTDGSNGGITMAQESGQCTFNWHPSSGSFQQNIHDYPYSSIIGSARSVNSSDPEIRWAGAGRLKNNRIWEWTNGAQGYLMVVDVDSDSLPSLTVGGNHFMTNGSLSLMAKALRNRHQKPFAIAISSNAADTFYYKVPFATDTLGRIAVNIPDPNNGIKDGLLGLTETEEFRVYGKAIVVDNTAGLNRLLTLKNTDGGNFSGASLKFFNNVGTGGTNGYGLEFYSNGTSAPFTNAMVYHNYEGGPHVFYGQSAELGRFNDAGELQIGSATDLGSSRLQITGTIEMQDGNQGSGKVLTSDANGVGTWQTGAATTIYTGNGTLAADRNVSSGGFTLRFDGANNSDTLVSITNTGTSSTGLYSIGSLFGVDAQSTTTGLRAFGSTTGMTAEGGTNEGAVIKSDAIRGVTIQSVPATTNTVQEVARFERGVNGSPGANGIGGSVTFYNKRTDNSSDLSNSLTSKFTNAVAANLTSQFIIAGKNNGSDNTVLTIDGDGTMTTAGKRIMSLVTSSAGTLTIGNAEAYVFNGTTTTWTLPAVSGTTGTIYYLKNIGSGTITLNSSGGGNDIYSTSAVNTLAITAGTSVILISNGTYFTTN